MWTRAELKSTARQILQKNYWSGVLVTLILSIVIGNFSFGTSVNFNDVTDYITNTGNSILTDNSYMEYTDQSANLQFNILRTRLLGIIKNISYTQTINSLCQFFRFRILLFVSQLNFFNFCFCRHIYLHFIFFIILLIHFKSN